MLGVRGLVTLCALALLACVPPIPLEDAGVAQPPCGNGVVDDGEDCDGDVVGAASCLTVAGAFRGGALDCNADCTFNVAGCIVAVVSCDGIQVDPSHGEECDGADLGGKTCSSLDLGGGELRCYAGCVLDVRRCTKQPVCGDGAVEPGEMCDALDEPGLCDDQSRPVPEPGRCQDGLDNDGDGDVDCADTQCLADVTCAGTLVAPPGSVLQDVAQDGKRIAFLDADPTLLGPDDPAPRLSIIPPGGGEPAVVALNTTRAIFAGNVLIAFHGNLENGQARASIEFPDGTSTTVESLKIGTVDASPDGSHVYFAVDQQGGDAKETLFLDGRVLRSNVLREKARFTSNSRFLVVGANFGNDDPASHIVVTVPTDSTDPLGDQNLIAEGAANQTAVTHDGATVIFGANERHASETVGLGNAVDLSAAPIEGGSVTELVADVEDAGFRVTFDNREVLYITDRNATNANQLMAVPLVGGEPRLVAMPAVRIVDNAETIVVYATDDRRDTGLSELSAVSLDGASQTVLGENAQRENFTADRRYFVFRDELVLVADPNGKSPGNLQAFDTSTLGGPGAHPRFIAPDVIQVAIADSSRVVFLDTAGALAVADLDGNDTRVIFNGVVAFKLVHDLANGDASRVAYQTAAGIFVAGL